MVINTLKPHHWCLISSPAYGLEQSSLSVPISLTERLIVFGTLTLSLAERSVLQCAHCRAGAAEAEGANQPEKETLVINRTIEFVPSIPANKMLGKRIPSLTNLHIINRPGTTWIGTFVKYKNQEATSKAKFTAHNIPFPVGISHPIPAL